MGISALPQISNLNNLTEEQINSLINALITYSIGDIIPYKTNNGIGLPTDATVGLGTNGNYFGTLFAKNININGVGISPDLIAELIAQLSSNGIPATNGKTIALKPRDGRYNLLHNPQFNILNPNQYASTNIPASPTYQQQFICPRWWGDAGKNYTIINGGVRCTTAGGGYIYHNVYPETFYGLYYAFKFNINRANLTGVDYCQATTLNAQHVAGGNWQPFTTSTILAINAGEYLTIRIACSSTDTFSQPRLQRLNPLQTGTDIDAGFYPIHVESEKMKCYRYSYTPLYNVPFILATNTSVYNQLYFPTLVPMIRVPTIITNFTVTAPNIIPFINGVSLQNVDSDDTTLINLTLFAEG